MAYRYIRAPLLASILLLGVPALAHAQAEPAKPLIPAPGSSTAGGSPATAQSGVPSSGTGETATAVRAQDDPAQTTPTNPGDDPKKPERTRENERGSTDVNRPN